MIRAGSRRGTGVPLWLTMAALALAAAVPPAALPAPQPLIGAGQPVAVICVKYSDAATTRLASAADWIATLNRDVNPFYNQATFNQTNFSFEMPAGGPADGWFSLGFPASEYDFDRVARTAIDMADPFLDFTRYHRVLIIANWPAFGAQGDQFAYWYPTDEGSEATFMEGGAAVPMRQMTVLIGNEWVADGGGAPYGGPFDDGAATIAHELGHNLGVPTHYSDIMRGGVVLDAVSPWDLMGFSPTLNHFCGWAKANRGWVPAGRVASVGPPMGADINQLVTLKPLERAAVGTQLLKVPFTPGEPFLGYVVENRVQVNGDERLPEPGVLVSLVSEHPDTVIPNIVLEDAGSLGNINQAPLEEGDAFTDASRNLTITFESRAGEDANVRVRYRLPARERPDPAVRPWGAPPFETEDIWIDSERNGWDVYRYTDASGNPTGNGDHAWVDLRPSTPARNRVYVRVRNDGPGVAVNVRVQMYVNDPPGMGDRGASWTFLGTILIPRIDPLGGTATGFVPWRATVDGHTCVKAQLRDVPGELSTENNRAQENVTHFETTRASPWKPVEVKIEVNNPYRKQTPVRFNFHDIPPGWAIEATPRQLLLPPNGRDFVAFRAFPSGPPDGPPGDQYQTGFLGRPKIEALVPWHDTFRSIGGVELWTHLVDAAQVTCDALQSGKIISQPPEVPQFPRGQPVTFHGHVKPPTSSPVVAVEFFQGRKRTMVPAKSNEDGTFTATFTPQKPGSWSAQAFFDGTQTLGQAQSDPCPFKVNRR